MKAKALVALAVALVVVAAIAGEGWGYVNLNPIREASFKINYSEIKNKPDENLTWLEAYVMARMNFENFEKCKHYADIMLEKNNSREVQALYYVLLSDSADSTGDHRGDPYYAKPALYYLTKLIEVNPDGIVDTGLGIDSDWITFDHLLVALRDYGYHIPREAFEFPREIYYSKKWRQLKTQEDLERIGFYRWKEEYVEPLYERQPSSLEKAVAWVESGRISRRFLYAAGGGLLFIAVVGMVIYFRRR